ncbi:MAG: hypothetical protein LBT99_01205 [Bifidobacteriaceae bacterium]|jgi:hypothetical protein|nr:hypothetical protein [Bifidobacteriaceae bacterium]
MVKINELLENNATPNCEAEEIANLIKQSDKTPKTSNGESVWFKGVLKSLNNKLKNSHKVDKKDRIVKITKADKSWPNSKKPLVILCSITGFIIVLVLVAISLFLWPGWIRKQVGLEHISPSMAIVQPDKTPLQKAIPLYDKDYALSQITAGVDKWYSLANVPQESYSLVYKQSGNNDTDINVMLGQWANDKTATKVVSKLQSVYSAEPVDKGVVLANGQAVGQYYIYASKSDKPAMVIWTNKSLVIQAVGPFDNLKSFYNGYSF